RCRRRSAGGRLDATAAAPGWKPRLAGCGIARSSGAIDCTLGHRNGNCAVYHPLSAASQTRVFPGLPYPQELSMANASSAGARFRAALEAEKPLQIVGAVNAYTAMLAQAAGFRAIYLSGGGVANASLGLPDLAITTLHDVLIDVDRITSACPLPLMVDIDTGFGGVFNIARTVKSLVKQGAGALHMEDQVAIKRCGHRPGKAVVP